MPRVHTATSVGPRGPGCLIDLPESVPCQAWRVLVEVYTVPSTVPQLTGPDGGEDGEAVGRNVEYEHVLPAAVIVAGAADECRHIVSLRQEEVGRDDLDQREGEDDQGLDQDAPPFLAGSETRRSRHRDLAGQVAQDLEYASSVQCVQGEGGVHLEVAPAVAGIPLRHIVVPPDEGVHDVIDVENHGADAPDSSSELAILP